MPSLLTHLRIDSIGLVDKGASGDAHHRPAVVLFKRHPEAGGEEKPMSLFERIRKAFGTVTPELPADRADALAKAAAEAIAKAACPQCGAAMPEGAKFCPSCGAKAGGGEPPTPGGDVGKKDPTEKNHDGKEPPVDQEITKKLEAAEAERAKLAKRVQELEDDKAERELVAKVEKDMRFIPGMSTTEIAKVLKHAKATMDEKGYEAFEKSLKSASATIAKSALLTEQGASGDGKGDAYAKLQGIAKSLREKDPTLGESAAIAKACDLNPELGRQYLAERE